MGYVRKKFLLKEKMIAFKFLIKNFSCTMGEAQKWIDRGRVFLNGEVLQKKNIEIEGFVEVLIFEPKRYGLKPIFETEDFAVFDKPSGVLIHPKMLNDERTLNDDIKYLFGKDANAVHRIDKGTSGLVLVSKNKNSERELKEIFANRGVVKSYMALVFGHVKDNVRIDANLKSDLIGSKIRIKSHVDKNGQIAITDIIPLKYFKKNDMSLVLAMPLTGRTHQIRAHLFHVKHSIVGDMIYCVSEDDADRYLVFGMTEREKIELSGAKRLMLHAQSLSFKFGEVEYNIESKIDFKGLIDECGIVGW